VVFNFSRDLLSSSRCFCSHIICATESWLKGVKPGVNPTIDAIKSCEIFPPNCNVYRNDRGTLGGGVFMLVEKSITSVEGLLLRYDLGEFLVDFDLVEFPV
jgi:hypothetical protein